MPEPNPADQPVAITEARVTELVAAGFKNFVEKQIPTLFKPVNDQLSSIGTALQTLNESNATVKTPPATSGVDPETNTVIVGLRKQVEALTKGQADEKTARQNAEAKALKTDQESKVRSVLSGFDFVTDDAREDAFSLINPLISRDSEGNLVGGDLTAEAFIKDFVPSKKAHLLAPVGVKGGGPTKGSPRTGATPISIESIKPNMSAAEIAAVAGALHRASADLLGTNK